MLTHIFSVKHKIIKHNLPVTSEVYKSKNLAYRIISNSRHCGYSQTIKCFLKKSDSWTPLLAIIIQPVIKGPGISIFKAPPMIQVWGPPFFTKCQPVFCKRWPLSYHTACPLASTPVHSLCWECEGHYLDRTNSIVPEGAKSCHSVRMFTSREKFHSARHRAFSQGVA